MSNFVERGRPPRESPALSFFPLPTTMGVTMAMGTGRRSSAQIALLIKSQRTPDMEGTAQHIGLS